MTGNIPKTLLILLIIFSSIATASTRDPAPKYWHLFKEAGEKYQVDPKLLLAIAKTESSLNCVAIGRNKNKSLDVGVMQINSWWFKRLKKYSKNLNALYEPRFNIHIGAWIFKRCTNRFGVSWKAIDCYNKGESKAHNNSAYCRKVSKNYKKIKYKNFK